MKLFKKAIASTILAATALTGVSQPIQAQQGYSVTGQWQCSMNSRRVDGSSSNLGNSVEEFAIDFHPDGSFQSQGSSYAQVIGYAEPFTAQGRWELKQERGHYGLIAQGTQNFQTHQRPFYLAAIPSTQNTMIFNAVLPIGTQMAIMCQR